MAERSSGEVEYISGMREAGLDTDAISDDELGEMYREAAGEVEDSDSVVDDSDSVAGSEGEGPLRVEGFKVYGADGQEVEDLRGLQIEDLIGKATLGYTALGKEQRKTLAEVVRNAQLGHLNATRQDQLDSDLNRMRELLETNDRELGDLRGQSAVWDRVLQQAAAGNIEPLQKLIDKFAEGLGAERQPVGPDAESLKQREYELAGREILDKEIRPYLREVSEQFGVEDYQGLENYALQGIARIPRQLQTPERVGRYLAVELPAELERMSIGREPAEVGASAAESTELKKQLADLQSQLKELKGEKKLDDAPPGSGSASSHGAGDSGFESADGDFDMTKFRQFLQDR